MVRTTIGCGIDVAAPATAVYNQWTQFEEFPNFMDGIDAVKQVDAKHLHWRAHVGPRKVEWDAEIVEQRPDAVISWRSTSGAENSGTVRFTPLGPYSTRIDLTLEFAPEGFFELLGDALGAVARRVEGDLLRFKQFLEQRGAETGGWRGTIVPSDGAHGETSTGVDGGSSEAADAGVAFERRVTPGPLFRFGVQELNTPFPA